MTPFISQAPGGPTGVGKEVEFPFIPPVALPPVALLAIVLPLEVWLPCIIVCACADMLLIFIAAAATTATNTPTVMIVMPNPKVFSMS